jgi:hypothetical protein
MRELQLLLNRHDSDYKFHHLNNRIRCFPHIINICVSHIIASCTRVSKEYLESLRCGDDDDISFSSLNIENDDDDDDDDDDGDDDDGDGDDGDGDDDDNDDDDDGDDDDDIPFPRRARQHIPRLKLQKIKLDGLSAEEVAWFSNIKRDPIKRARRVIRILRSSDQRKRQFKQVIKNGNDSGWFRDANSSTIKVPDVEPLRDVKTRWDSTFMMIERLLVLQPVSAVSHFNHAFENDTRIQAIDLFFNMEVHELSDFKLTDIDWELLQSIGMVLLVSFRADLYVTLSTCFSGSSQRPTSHVC